MNKKIILSLSMLTSLGGCANKKEQKKPKQIEQAKADIFTTSSLPLFVDAQREHDDEQVTGFFDEELGEFVFADTTETSESIRTVAENTAIDTIAWTQVEDEHEQFPTLYFDYDKYVVNQDQQTDIALIAEKIKDLMQDLDENEVISIEGHACHYKGTELYNYGLSKNRATAVYDALIAQGVNPERLRIVARGQDVPAIVDGKPVTGNKDQQWPNRRVEIRVVDIA